MASRFASLVAALVLAGACQLPRSQPTCNVIIDWVNFVQIGSTRYVAGPESPSVLPEGDLGLIYAHVKFKVSGNVCDPGYLLKDGDAAFLEPVTPLYQVNGHAASEQLAARFNGSIVAYKAMVPAG